jgi:hypothetical protein
MVSFMPNAETKVVASAIDVDRRLSELDMHREDILNIRKAACDMHAAGSSPFFPPNGAGLLAYLYGTHELRKTFLERNWKIDRNCSPPCSGTMSG